MVKNIIIGVLVVFSLGFLTFAFYQKTLAENARMEAVECAEISRKAQEEAKKAVDKAYKAMLEAMEQKQIAEMAHVDATQKLRAEKTNK
ncbi:MAG TPA: hypothetical protein PKL31_17075 [Fulvivirga sp.]|nr:hypothetical protein [Fulvivirga sp.]